MAIVEFGSIEQVREDLRRIAPPYLLRKYEATEDDYEQLADEDLRCELLDGVLIVHSPASSQHEERVMFLGWLIHTFMLRGGLGRLFGSNTVMHLGHRRFCPDVSLLLHEHADRLQGGRVIGPMDLVIELMSPSTRAYDLGEKRPAYQAGRIPEIWLFDLQRKECHVDWLEGDAYRTATLATGWFASRVLPGLRVAVDWLWADPLPKLADCLKSATP